MVPDVPQRAVFFAETPQGEGLQAELARGAHLIEDGDAVEKPHHVALIIVLVDVLEVGIERVVIEIEIGVGVGGALPGIGDGKILSVRGPAACDGGDLSDWEWKASSRSRSCPVAQMIFSLGTILSTRSRLPMNHGWLAIGPGIAGGLVLVVVHQHDAVGVGGDGFQIAVAGGDGHVDVEAEIARMHLGVKRLNEAQVGGIGIVGNAFDVEREAAIGRVCDEEAHDLLEEARRFCPDP